jgi:hypothetical protein
MDSPSPLAKLLFFKPKEKEGKTAVLSDFRQARLHVASGNFSLTQAP